MTSFAPTSIQNPSENITLRNAHINCCLWLPLEGQQPVLPADPWDQARQIVAGIKEPKFKDQDFLLPVWCQGGRHYPVHPGHRSSTRSCLRQEEAAWFVPKGIV
jgi:hypothetical protein